MARNPVFTRIDKEVRGYAGFGSAPAGPGYGSPQAGYGYPQAGPAPVSADRVLTVDDVVMKSFGLFAVVVAVAAGAWIYSDHNPAMAPTLWLGGMFGTLALGLVLGFMRSVSVPLIVAYAVLEGLFIGALSRAFETQWHGAVPTAVVATMSVFAAMFLLYRTRIIRVNDRFRGVVGLAVMGYFLFALVNLVFSFLGWGGGWGAFGTGIGPVISLFAIGLAAASLATDFDSIERAVAARMPEKYSWLLAHGLIVTLVWLYVEILRLIALSRDR